MASVTTHLELGISGMTCAACATRIEKVLNRVPSVVVSVNFATEHACLNYDPAQADIDAIIGAPKRIEGDAISESRVRNKGAKCAVK